MRRLSRTAALTAAIMLLTALPASAQEVNERLDALELNTLVVFMMLATVLVFIMHAGFSLLEAGFTRQKNAANIIGKNLMTVTVGMLAYFVLGWGVMYGASYLGLFGTDSFLLTGSSYDPIATLEVDFAFQAMFAATAATIVSGAVAERMKFGSYLIVAVVMTAIVYPVVGAWTWAGGWLADLGFQDFAGSTIVHLTGGSAALVAARILGPRIGKFDPRSGQPRAIPGHSMPLAALGALLLFFGWFGFNGGSVLAIDGPVIGAVIVTTALAGAAGGVAAAILTRLEGGKWDVAMIINGILAGLVGVTAGADRISNAMALAVGVLGGLLVVKAVSFIDARGIDDPVGAVSVHGAAGILGTVWVGLAANDGGLFNGGGTSLLVAQLVGIVAVVAWVAVATGALFLLLKSRGSLRVSEREELEGLDIHEHGFPGYPELVFGAGGAGGPSS